MPVDARGGHPTYWQAFGNGPLPALAVHCSLAHSGSWSGIAGALRSRLTITAFDLPGHGKSADLPVGADFPALSVAIGESFLDGPLDLIGHSFGGLIALRLALLHPHRVRSLTLIEPVLFAAAEGTPEYTRHLSEMVGYEAAALAGDAEGAARAFMALWGGDVDWHDLPPRVQAAHVARIHLIAAGAPLTVDRNGHLLHPGGLEALNLPVLLLRGSTSPAVMAPICDRLAARLPDARLRVVDGAGHMLPMTHVPEVAALIGDFLSPG